MKKKVKIGPLVLKNPVTVASGTYNFAQEMQALYDPSRLGAIFLKGITVAPRQGNKAPRICETPSGFLNSIGLQNPGIRGFLGLIYPKIAALDTELIANISGFGVDEYLYMARLIDRDTDMKAVEVNISCPNIHAGGKIFASDLELVKRIISTLREKTDLILILKLSPNVNDIGELAAVCEESGAHMLSAINTLLGMDINLQTRRPSLANTVGGLSGPAVFPVALRCVYQMAQNCSLPIIGMGGIDSFDSMLKMIYAGASAISIGTANFYEPDLPIRLIDQMEDFLKEEDCGLDSLCGIAHQKKEEK